MRFDEIQIGSFYFLDQQWDGGAGWDFYKIISKDTRLSLFVQVVSVLLAGRPFDYQEKTVADPQLWGQMRPISDFKRQIWVKEITSHWPEGRDFLGVL
jgi:hypothetical protein